MDRPNRYGENITPIVASDHKLWSEATALDIIEKNIADFPEFLKNSAFDWNDLPVTFEGEDKITEKFCTYYNTLSDKKRQAEYDKKQMYILTITNQTKDTGHRTNDAGVEMTQINPSHKSLPIVLRIEAKRLPTPGTGRTKEYVTHAKGGGIERFKTGAHGRDLTKSIMLAYVQKNDFAHWHTQVNTWIEAQIAASDNKNIDWNEQDKLKEKPNLGAVNKYASKHSRQNTPNDIELQHYWLNLILKKE